MKRTPLARRTPLRQTTAPKRASRLKTRVRRDWSDARAKVEREAVCRICGRQDDLEAAHTIAREHDTPVFDPAPGGATHWVNPDSIVPLCRSCHTAYDHHELDLLGKLAVAEELDAVMRAGGLENARVRLCPTAYKVAA